MDHVPAYLLLYLLKIRKHSGEGGYLARRLKDADLGRALDEKAMLRELEDLHLIAVSENKEEVLFDQRFVDLLPGVPEDRQGEVRSAIDVPYLFVVAMRGRYVWVEVLLRYLGWLATAVVCGIAGGLAVVAQGDMLQAWALAVCLCVCLPLLACLGIVLTNPKAAR